MPHRVYASYYHLTKALGEFQPAVGYLIKIPGHSPGQVLQFDTDSNKVVLYLPDSLYDMCDAKIGNHLCDVIDVPYDRFMAENPRNSHGVGTDAYNRSTHVCGKVVYFKGDGKQVTVVGIATPVHGEYWRNVARSIPTLPSPGRPVPYELDPGKPLIKKIYMWRHLKALNPSLNCNPPEAGGDIYDFAGKKVAKIHCMVAVDFEEDGVGLVTIWINREASWWWEDNMVHTTADETLVNEIGPAPIRREVEDEPLPLPIPRRIMPEIPAGRATRAISL